MRKRWFGFAGSVMVGGASLVAATACGSGLAASDCEASRTCADADEPSAGAGGDSTEPGAAGATGGLSLPDGGESGEPSGGGAAGGSEGGANDDTPVNVAPFVVEITPKNDASELEPDEVITIAFSEPLAPASVNTMSVQLFDGQVPVAGSVSYADSQVTFKPDAPLRLLGDYELHVSEAVTDPMGAHLAQPFESHFSVRDGRFSTQVAVGQPSFQLAEALPMTAQGRVLLAWSDYGKGALCPVLGQWFSRATASDADVLTAPGVTECDSVVVGANASGVAAVGWAVPDATHGTYVKQIP
ncbi:MAG TPA: Ig-like domain-containing protein [Polyangiaceae bacterium]|nr:Ig-like domain-containing protein [Polyangiaceae bacterium]